MTEILVLDFECFFSREFTLKKLTTEAYIRSDEFEALTLSMGRYEASANQIIMTAQGPEEIGKWIKAIDWKNTAIIAQNAAFDAGILGLRYGVRPKLVMCTMSMERAIAGPGKSASLAAMCERYGLPQKKVPYNAFIGKRFSELDEDPELLGALVSGCEHDVWLTREIARRQLAVFPKQELPIVDMTIRMFTEPQFCGDAPKLRAMALEEFERKGEAMEALGVTAAELQSTDKFVALLEDCGEEVPVKQSKLKEIACVAKTDSYMQELSSRMDRAGLLAQARLDVRSTLDEARASRLAGSAERGLMPVALNYCGAATTRWSGADKVNWQNLTPPVKATIKTPPGKKIVSVDAAQIQYRLCCGLAGQMDKLEALRAGRDIYCEFGTERLFDHTITKAEHRERQFSKTIVLGGIFGVGKDRFLRECEAKQIEMDYEIKLKAIPAFRADHTDVVSYWRLCDQALGALADTSFVGRPDGMENSPIYFDRGSVVLPNGLKCPFKLEWDQGRNGWVRQTRYGFTNYWGGGLTEFFSQALEQVYMREIFLKALVELGIRPALTTHDDVDYVVEEENAQSVKDWIENWMGRPPAWMPWVPMKGEGRIGDTLGK